MSVSVSVSVSVAPPLRLRVLQISQVLGPSFRRASLSHAVLTCAKTKQVDQYRETETGKFCLALYESHYPAA